MLDFFIFFAIIKVSRKREYALWKEKSVANVFYMTEYVRGAWNAKRAI